MRRSGIGLFGIGIGVWPGRAAVRRKPNVKEMEETTYYSNGQKESVVTYDDDKVKGFILKGAKGDLFRFSFVGYKEKQIGTRRVDFFVENEIMVELKAIILLEDVHLAQAINYLEAYNMKTGLLINFGSQSLTFKRLMNKKYKIN